MLKSFFFFFFAKQNLDWKEKLHAFCIDGAPAMLGKSFSFAILVKMEVPNFAPLIAFYTDLHWQQRLFKYEI
jgi:hypothetical protein